MSILSGQFCLNGKRTSLRSGFVNIISKLINELACNLNCKIEDKVVVFWMYIL